MASVALLVLVIIGGFVAWQTLPTAEITITPHVATIGPLEIPVMATAEVDAVDSESGLVPAVLVPIPLSAEDGYDSSGTRTAGSRASGSVVFSAQDQAFDQEIAAGTRVLTPAGTAFATTETVILRRSQLGRSEVRADVEAIATGDVGNVPAGAISVVPSLEDQGIGVDNPEPTSGGRLQETPLVVAGDYDAAAVDLRNRLAGQLAAYLDDPANSPAGLTLFPETAVLGPVTLEPPAAELVGSGVASFTLAGSARAGVLAVDMGSVEALLRERLTAAVPAGMAILSDSVVVEPGEGIAEGDGIAFAGVTSGRAVTVIDRDELLDRIAGLPVSDARSILDALGSATVNVWPEFLGDLPEDRQRITLDIVAVSATE